MSSDPFRIFPPATPQQREELKASIESVGIKSPVVVDEDGNVIDGHERRDTGADLGVDWMAGADVRIGLTDDQKKALAIELNMWRRPIHLDRKKRSELIDIYLIAHPELSEPQVADLFGVSQPTINRRKRRLMQMHKISPVTATIGKDGKTRRIGDRSKTARLIVRNRKEYEKYQPDIRAMAGEVRGIIRRPAKLHSTVRRKRLLADIEQSPHKELPPEIKLYTGDFRELPVEEKSVDLVLTDPLWSRKHVDDWRALSEHARRWLKPEGLLVSWFGTETLPEFWDAMRTNLKWRWQFILKLQEYRRSWSHGQIETYRSLSVFQQPEVPYIRLEIPDSMESSCQAKDYGEYQQDLSVARKLIEGLTRPGAVICDPFLGSGTTAVAVAQLAEGRTFVGGDILPDRVDIARHRVSTEGAADWQGNLSE